MSKPQRQPKVWQKPTRTSLLNVRLNIEERRLFERCARNLGISLSSWARMVLRKEVGQEGWKWQK